MKPTFRNTILIIQNKPSPKDLFLDYLRGSGFKVLEEDSGENALETAAEIMPDIILLDVILPGIDGFETCRRLKESHVTKDIPVIFITTQDSTVNKVRGFMLGAVDYISRPVHVEELLARLKTQLTLQRLQKDMEAKNLQLQQEITERNKLIEELDAFAHTVAHDLKNPLGVMITHAQFVQNYSQELGQEETNKTLEQIVRTGRKMNNIINELLLLSSVRTEDVTPRPIDMVEIANEATSRLKFLVKEHDAEIIFIDQEYWPQALGYGPWLEEVWTNYISNAIKYGGRPPCVQLGATPEAEGLVRYWVRDNGVGLNATEQSRLFTPFNRLNQINAEGHGLGLSIVQRIVKKLNGRVGVSGSQQPGQGSTFSFYLPAADGS